jgi:hypothetical protein
MRKLMIVAVFAMVPVASTGCTPADIENFRSAFIAQLNAWMKPFTDWLYGSLRGAGGL